MVTRLILDTDIGTDVDDLFALAMILGSPEIRLEGVTCVYADVELRARIVEKILRLRGASYIPIRLGVNKPLLGIKPVFWGGHEGQFILQGEAPVQFSDEHAIDFIIRMVMDNPGEIHLLAIGPLTNIALALLKEPRIAEKMAHLTIMGGVLRGPELLSTRYAEHNIVCDPEAAHIVFSSGAPITLIPLDVTEQVQLTTADMERLRTAGTAYHEALAGELESWLETLSRLLNEERTFTHMHDPLAAASIIDPSVVQTVPVHIDLELHGIHSAGITLMRTPTAQYPANAEVALQVKTEDFDAMLRDRINRTG